jgi:ribonuclease HII
MTRKIDPGLIPSLPDLHFEDALLGAGCQSIAGIDEAGRGCLAGPVVAAIVILSLDKNSSDDFAGVQDSKQLSYQERDRLRAIIEDRCLAWAVGSASHVEIDQFGILPATRIAIKRALDQINTQPDHLLVDYIVLPDIPIPQTRLVKGDKRSLSIASASILAKTHRDSMMIKLAEQYPYYGFDKNKGYGTIQHKLALNKYGPTPHHRMSFAPLKNP